MESLCLGYVIVPPSYISCEALEVDKQPYHIARIVVRRKIDQFLLNGIRSPSSQNRYYWLVLLVHLKASR